MQFLRLHKSWTVGTNCFEWICGLWIQAGCGCSLKLQGDCDRVCIPLEKAPSNDFQWALINPDTASASGSWTISPQIHGRTIMRLEIFQHRIALNDEGVMKTLDTNVFISTNCLIEKLTFNHRSFNWICEPVLLRNALSQDTSCHCHPSVFWILSVIITAIMFKLINSIFGKGSFKVKDAVRYHRACWIQKYF